MAKDVVWTIRKSQLKSWPTCCRIRPSSSRSTKTAYFAAAVLAGSSAPTCPEEDWYPGGGMWQLEKVLGTGPALRNDRRRSLAGGLALWSSSRGWLQGSNWIWSSSRGCCSATNTWAFEQCDVGQGDFADDISRCFTPGVIVAVPRQGLGDFHHWFAKADDPQGFQRLWIEEVHGSSHASPIRPQATDQDLGGPLGEHGPTPAGSWASRDVLFGPSTWCHGQTKSSAMRRDQSLHFVGFRSGQWTHDGFIMAAGHQCRLLAGVFANNP